MSYLPELRASLVRAAAVESAKHRSAVPTGRRQRFGWLGPALAAGVTVAVVAVALLLVGHRGHAPANAAARGPAYHLTVPPVPPSPNPTGAQWSLIEGARRATVARDRACSPSVKLPAVTPGGPAPALTSILGILRLPASAADSAPLDFAQHWPPGIYTSAIRRARSVDGVALYIVPTANVLALRTVARRCLSEEAAALRRQAKGDPASQVAAALAVQRRWEAWQQYEARHPEGICLAELDRGGAGGLACGWGVGEIEEGMAGLGGTDRPGPNLFHGIVPDGVSSVVLQLPRHQGTVAAKVVGNVWLVRLPLGVSAPARIVWRAGSGAVIKTTGVP